MASWSLLLHLKSYRSFGSSWRKKAAKKSEAETSKGARLQACTCRVQYDFFQKLLRLSSRSASAHHYRLCLCKAVSGAASALGVFFIARQGLMRIHRCMPAGFEFLPPFAAFLSFRSPLLVVPPGLLTRKLTDIILGALAFVPPAIYI